MGYINNTQPRGNKMTYNFHCKRFESQENGYVYCSALVSHNGKEIGQGFGSLPIEYNYQNFCLDTALHFLKEKGLISMRHDISSHELANRLKAKLSISDVIREKDL